MAFHTCIIGIIFFKSIADTLPPIKVYGTVEKNLVSTEPIEINKEKSLTEQLKKSPFVQVQSYGGENSEPQIRIRGLDAIQNRYYLSDLPLTNAQFQSSALQLIPQMSVERVSILPTIPARLLGDGLGGSLNFELFSWEKIRSTQVLLQGGSYQYMKLIGSTEQTLLLPIRLDIQWNKSAENFTFRNDNGTAWNFEDDFWAIREKNEFEKITFFPQVLIQKSSEMQTDVFSLNAFQRVAVPGSFQGFSFGEYQQFLNLTSLNNTVTFKEGSLKTSAFIRLDGQRVMTSTNSLAIQPRKSFERLFGVQTKAKLAPFQLALGLQFENYAIEYTNDNQYTSRVYLPMALSVDLKWGDFKITPEISAQYSQQSQAFWGFSPRVSTQYFLSKDIAVFSNHGIFNRLPSLFELQGSVMGVVANPNLNQEYAVKNEIGVEVLDFYSHKMGLNLYSIRAWNLIHRFQNTAQTMQYYNIGEGILWGQEFWAQINFFKYFTVSPTLIHSTATNLTPISYQYDRELPHRPNWVFKLELAVKYFDLEFVYSTIFNEGFYLDVANLARMQSFWQLDLGLRYSTKKFGRWTFDLLNLTDTMTGPYSFGQKVGTLPVSGLEGYPIPGRRVYLSWSYEI